MKKNKIFKLLVLAELCIFFYGCSSKIVVKSEDLSKTQPNLKDIKKSEPKKRDLVVKITESILEKAKEKNLNIAVVEFSELRGSEYVESSKGKLVSERLITALVNSKSVTVIERGQLEKVLTELKLNMKGVIDSSSAKQVGKILGIDAIITGTIIELNNVSEINARMIDTQTGKIMSAVNVQEKIDLPANVNNQHALPLDSEQANLTSKVQRQRPPLPPKPPMPPMSSRPEYRDGDVDRMASDRPFQNRDRRRPGFIPDNMNNRGLKGRHREGRGILDEHNYGGGFDRFSRLLKNNKFNELARLAEKELHNNPDNQRVKFYLGVSLVELGINKHKKHILKRGRRLLKSILKNKDVPPHLRKEAALVLVDSLFRLGKKGEAKRLLGKLLRRAPEFRKRPKIQELIRSLE